MYKFLKQKIKKIIFSVLLMIFTLTGAVYSVYAAQSQTYQTVIDEHAAVDCQRFVTIDLAGGTTSKTIKVWYVVDHGGINSKYNKGTWHTYNNIIGADLYDKTGALRTINQYGPSVSYNNLQTFTDSVNEGSNYQHHDCIGNTPYIFIYTPTREGYTFDGWQVNGTNINALSENVLTGYKPSNGYTHFEIGAYMRNSSGGSDITITATWKKNAVSTGNITFVAGDSHVKSVTWNGTGYSNLSLKNAARQTYTGNIGASLSASYAFDDGYTLDYTTVSDRSGEKFTSNPDNWSVKEGTRVVTIYSKANNGTVSFKAGDSHVSSVSWNNATYNISTTTSKDYNATVGKDTSEVTYNTAKGYHFEHAQSDDNVKSVKNPCTWTIKNYKRTVTIYSAANTYTINYNGNGNTGGSTSSGSHTYDIAKNLTANGYTKTGYTFNGWNIKADGTGTSYSDKQSVKNLTSANGGTVTLYAQWKDNTPPEWITTDSSGNKVSGGLYVMPSSWTNGSTVITAAAKDTGSGISNVKIYNSSNKELATGSSSATYTQSTEGIIYYYAIATDKAGNKTTTEKKVAYVDKTPPAITSGVSSSGWTNQDIRLTATATDALSGVQKVEIYTSSGKLAASGKTGASYTITAQTNEEYIIRATDAAGNVAEKKESIQIDKENSDVIIDSGNDTPSEFKPGAAVENCIIGWINKDVTIKVTATDSMSGIKSIELKDHYGYVIKRDTKELQYTFTNEGISHYVITVTDNAGNTKTINLTVKIDKTSPEIIGEEEVKDPNYGLIEHQAADTLSGIKTFKLYYYDTMQEVTEADGLEYKDGNIIYFKSMNTFNLYWKLIAEDNAGNITEMTVHTPFNFKIKVEADNLRTETENFLIGAEAQLKITLWGYVDTVEVKFERTLENAAEKEEYTLDRLIESGDAFVRVPEKNDCVEYTFKLPEGVDPREYRIWVYGYRDGWKRTEYVDINLITYDQLCKEQVHKFKRVIKSPTWRKVDE